MAFNNGWYANWQSDECSDDSLTGQCDGFVPDNDPDAPGAECTCSCHEKHFFTTREVEKYHSDKHRDMQDGAFHNIPDAN